VSERKGGKRTIIAKKATRVRVFLVILALSSQKPRITLTMTPRQEIRRAARARAGQEGKKRVSTCKRKERECRYRRTANGEVEREERRGVGRRPLSSKGDENQGSDLGTLNELPDLLHLLDEADVLLHLDRGTVLALDLGGLCVEQKIEMGRKGERRKEKEKSEKVKSRAGQRIRPHRKVRNQRRERQPGEQ
jgi:hypothetical protein